MNRHQFDEFLIAVAIICGFGAMLNVAKFETRGASARYLAGAFVLMAVAVLLIWLNAPQILIDLAGAATFGLLGADIAYRLNKGPKKRARK